MVFRCHIAKSLLDEGRDGDPTRTGVPLGRRKQFSVNRDGKLLLHTGWNLKVIIRTLEHRGRTSLQRQHHKRRRAEPVPRLTSCKELPKHGTLPPWASRQSNLNLFTPPLQSQCGGFSCQRKQSPTPFSSPPSPLRSPTAWSRNSVRQKLRRRTKTIHLPDGSVPKAPIPETQTGRWSPGSSRLNSTSPYVENTRRPSLLDLCGGRFYNLDVGQSRSRPSPRTNYRNYG